MTAPARSAARAWRPPAAPPPRVGRVDDALAATLARSVHARASAGVPDVVPLASAGMLMRAGFPAGMMKEHLPKGEQVQSKRTRGDTPPDWTYHHIIPENVIEAFWTVAEPNAHKLELLTPDKQGAGALTKLVRRGYRQLREAAVYTLTLGVKAELFDQGLSPEQIKALAVQAVADLLPATGEPKTYDEAADRIIADSGAGENIKDPRALRGLHKDLTDRLAKAVAAAEMEGLHGEQAITTTLGAGATTKASAKVFDQMIRWMPGNIHQGPKSELRRNPASADFDPERDDGGNQFEVAARHLISEPHYATLVALNKAMVDYTKGPTDELLQRAGALLIDLTAYSVTEWPEVKHLWTEGADGLWRIRPRLKAIGGGRTPRGRPRKDEQAVYAVFQSLRNKTPAKVAGVYADYPAWTVTTTKDRRIFLDDWDQVVGPLYHGSISMGVAAGVLDDLFLATGGHERV